MLTSPTSVGATSIDYANLNEVAIPPSRNRFLTDHTTVFVKYLTDKPTTEYMAAHHAHINGVRTVEPLHEPIEADGGMWYLPYRYTPLTQMGTTSHDDQRDIADLLAMTWSTPPPAGLPHHGRDWYEERVTNRVREWHKHHPVLAQRLTRVAVAASARMTVRMSTDATRWWVHADPHGGNFGRNPHGDATLIDWGLSNVGIRENDAGKYLQSALTEQPGQGFGSTPTVFLDMVSNQGLNMDCVWDSAVRSAANARAFLLGSPHPTPAGVEAALDELMSRAKQPFHLDRWND